MSVWKQWGRVTSTKLQIGIKSMNPVLAGRNKKNKKYKATAI